MVGVRFRSASGAAIMAIAGLALGAVDTRAADLGGNCCADLEERVAELEATTARKGNRRVSLTISGHVNEAVLFWDDGVETGARMVTNGFNMTRFRFRGSAKISAEWSAGFYLEFGLGRTGMSSDVDQEDGSRGGGYSPPGIRHQALWIKSRSLGTIWLGHTTDAVDGLIDICLGCPVTSSSEASLGWGDIIVASGGRYLHQVIAAPAAVTAPGNAGPVPVGFENSITWASLGIGQEGHYGARTGLVKYVSPTFVGFSFSASWADADDGLAEYNKVRGHGYDWDVALRYAAEFGAMRFAAGGGYSEVSVKGAKLNSWATSGSLQHVPTGLYIHGNYRTQEAEAGGDDSAWAVQVGVAQKWSSVGKTTFWMQYAEHDNDYREFTYWDCSAACLDTDKRIAQVFGIEGQIISLGINQKIDAAALELYVTYWNVQGSGSVHSIDGTGEISRKTSLGKYNLDDLNVIMAGARIQF